jgi:hypothetical protein
MKKVSRDYFYAWADTIIYTVHGCLLGCADTLSHYPMTWILKVVLAAQTAISPIIIPNAFTV